MNDNTNTNVNTNTNTNVNKEKEAVYIDDEVAPDSVRWDEFEGDKLVGVYRKSSIKIDDIAITQQIISFTYKYTDKFTGPLRVEFPKVLCDRGIDVKVKTRKGKAETFISKSMYFSFSLEDRKSLKEFESRLRKRVVDIGYGKFFERGGKLEKSGISRNVKLFWEKTEEGVVVPGYENRTVLYANYSEYKRVTPTFTTLLGDSGKPVWVKDNSVLEGTRMIIYPLVDIPEIALTKSLSFRTFVAGGVIYKLPDRVNPYSQIRTLRRLRKDEPGREAELQKSLAAKREARKIASKLSEKFKKNKKGGSISASGSGVNVNINTGEEGEEEGVAKDDGIVL